jgi:hypothetical protein
MPTSRRRCWRSMANAVSPLPTYRGGFASRAVIISPNPPVDRVHLREHEVHARRPVPAVGLGQAAAARPPIACAAAPKPESSFRNPNTYCTLRERRVEQRLERAVEQRRVAERAHEEEVAVVTAPLRLEAASDPRSSRAPPAPTTSFTAVPYGPGAKERAGGARRQLTPIRDSRPCGWRDRCERLRSCRHHRGLQVLAIRSPQFAFATVQRSRHVGPDGAATVTRWTLGGQLRRHRRARGERRDQKSVRCFMAAD